MRFSALAPAAFFFLALAPSASAAPAAEGATAAPPSEEMLKVRDPFKRPDIEVSRMAPKSDLERFQVDAFKMVAVVTGPSRLRAMLLGPDGKTYMVSERMRIGTRNGVVRRITSDRVLVRERITNVLGQEENVDSEIRLLSDAKGAMAGK